MLLHTGRFGTLQVSQADVLTFEQGLIGMETCQRWILLADAQSSALGWLQSLDRPDIALAVVAPRRFVHGYRATVASRDLASLSLSSPKDAQVLVVVAKSDEGLTLNLKAPLVVNIAEGVGRQVVAKDDHPIRYLLVPTLPLRKSA